MHISHLNHILLIYLTYYLLFYDYKIIYKINYLLIIYLLYYVLFIIL